MNVDKHNKRLAKRSEEYRLGYLAGCIARARKAAKEASVAKEPDDFANKLQQLANALEVMAGVMVGFAAHNHINPYPDKLGNGKYAL